eukprot:TRINITY_DN37080_c2_g1_i1.p1 TRINITY_DN37080_c2_g1~~TRINITY_DN37080_c2_g1_i1.p1  ORF type:complete len:473 (-),score=77.93 TRINITY_DN37080_c2_g1_i1:71-1489(-)
MLVCFGLVAVTLPYIFSVCAVHSPLEADVARSWATSRERGPPLCDAKLVDFVCSKLGIGTFSPTSHSETDAINELSQARRQSPFPAAPTTMPKIVTRARDIAEHLMVSRDSLLDFFEQVRVSNIEENMRLCQKGVFKLDCTELCNQALQVLPVTERPPTSDIGCYRLVDKPAAVSCKIDLSYAELSKVKRQNASSTFSSDDEGVDHPPPAIWKTDQNAIKLEPVSAGKYPKRTPTQLLVGILNMFRIYPPGVVKFRVRAGAKLPLAPAAASTAQNAVVQVAMEARACVSVALINLAGEKLPSAVTTWFGNDTSVFRQVIRQTLNGVHQVLANLELIYPGSACGIRSLAYVDSADSRKSRNKKGNYIIKLCKRFFEISQRERVNSLLHVGLHHLPMDTRDIAYGKDKVLKLAERSPNLAVRNTESFVYFISDAVDHKKRTGQRGRLKPKAALKAMQKDIDGILKITSPKAKPK